MSDENVTDPGPGTGATGEPQRRPWFRSSWFLFLLAGPAVYLGLQFTGLIAIVLLISDRSRPAVTRAGGSLFALWWLVAVASVRTSTYGPIPYIEAFVLLMAVGVYARAALTEPAGRRRGVLLVLAATALMLGVTRIVPYGYRDPEIPREEAVAAAVASLRELDADERIEPESALADIARELQLHRPVWVVLLLERDDDTELTGDNEPCFGRLQGFVVDAFDGSVRRERLIEISEEQDGGCAAFPKGTKDDLVPVAPAR
jgi:hypothetical protein